MLGPVADLVIDGVDANARSPVQHLLQLQKAHAGRLCWFWLVRKVC